VAKSVGVVAGAGRDRRSRTAGRIG
jgi:hypothetical protein